ncbi:MAG: hypothetical protein ABFR65_12935 [Pseudomonadota bacterium]
MNTIRNNVHSFAEAKEEFESAWINPQNTKFELPAVDINEVLSNRYEVSKPVQLTRSIVWDMELKKAWDPATYIPYVVSRGQSWGRHFIDDGSERLFREITAQAWIADTSGPVFEDVFINHTEQKIIFLGRAELEAETGETIRTNGFQPLFNVEHAVGGTEGAPLNLWRIVILTENNDRRFHRPFEDMVKAGWLPGFLEIYIEKDLHVQLSRRQT